MRAARAFFLALALGSAAIAASAAGYVGGGALLTSVTGGVSYQLPATILKPDGAGPFPAVVILHDCSGLGAYSSGAPGRWGSLLASEGYVVLIPDSFLPRGFPDGVCTTRAVGRDAASPFVRSFDAYAALAYLRTLSFVDGRHVGVMGGSHGGSTVLETVVTRANPALKMARANGFAAAVALYPGCGGGMGPSWRVVRAAGDHGPVTQFIGTYEPLAPLRILIGGDDDWTPAEHCRVLAERAAAAGAPVTIKIYPGAQHAFDSNAPRRYLDGRNNVNKIDGHGATTGGDPAAWADAIKEVEAFFAAHLKPGH
jgi:dienelactone hydrolase